MRKILVILIIIIAAVILYINLNNTKNSTITNEEIKKGPTDSDIINNEETNPPENPDIYDYSKLTIDPKLKPVKLNIPDSLKWNKPVINVSAIIPKSVRLCDIFLLIDNKKIDMYYRAKSGKYIFRNVKLNLGISNIEVFYRVHKNRSISSSRIIIRE